MRNRRSASVLLVKSVSLLNQNIPEEFSFKDTFQLDVKEALIIQFYSSVIIEP
jgi:hypothetical protein